MRSQVQTVSDRVINTGAGAGILGLVSWYAGAADSIDRLLSVASLGVVACAVGVIAGLVALVMQRSARKRAIGDALFLAAAIAFVTFNTVALLNRYADSSEDRGDVGKVLSFGTPSKGPRTIRIALSDQHISLRASSAEGCDVGSSAAVELRAGALGSRWIQSVRCTPPSVGH